MKSDPGPLEKDIEKKVCDHAKKLGCLVYKFTSPAKRSVPDRLFIMPGARGVFFIEFKRLGNKPTPAQEIEIAKIRKQGISVFVVDETANGKAIVEKTIANAGGATVLDEKQNPMFPEGFTIPYAAPSKLRGLPPLKFPVSLDDL